MNPLAPLVIPGLRATGLGLALGLIGATATPVGAAPLPVPTATLYRGGDILTMAGPKPGYAEALVEKDGKILYVGPLAGAIKAAGAGARRVNLAGRTLLPGFIDAHGHFLHFGKNLMDADLFGSADVADVVTRMKAQAVKVPADAWIVGMGYKAIQLKEKRTPTVEELDAISADRPVVIVDSSGHLGAGNSAAFRAAGITPATPNPEGGVFDRKADGKSLAGPMEETALNAVRAKRPAFTGKLADDVVTGAATLWARYGQTTAMECAVGIGGDDIELLRNAIDKQLLPIDLYICAKDTATDATVAAAKRVAVDYALARPASETERQESMVAAAVAAPGDGASRLLAARPDLDKRYVNRVRLGGIKFWLDGSLDTAWFTQPYTNNPPGKQGVYSGYRQIPDQALDAAFDKYWTTNMQVNIHMNGDAAADQAINAIEKAMAKHGPSDHRPVFVHGTYLRPDQIAKLRKLGAIPSFLSTGMVSGGDSVVTMWGPLRAAVAMPANTLAKAGLPFTLSHDAPISPQPWILDLVDAAVNRTTITGQVVGPQERITPYLALRAVTAMAAFQIKEEKTKGTLEAGKLADLVVLDRNPLKVAPGTIKGIQVVETLKEAKSVYRRGPVDEPTRRAGPIHHSHSHGEEPLTEPLSERSRETLETLLNAATR